MGTAACELRSMTRIPTFASPSFSSSANLNGCTVVDGALRRCAIAGGEQGTGNYRRVRIGEDGVMRVQVQEAQSSTAEKPLWVWRVWCDGRLTEGFSPSEEDAKRQADLAQRPSQIYRRQRSR